MESIIEKAIEWFKDISEAAKELTSGNVSHKACAICGLANGSAEYLEECKESLSVIKWHTGEPKEPGSYLVSPTDGSIDFDFYNRSVEYYFFWCQYEDDEIIAWCKLSDIKPYKKETK